MCISLSYGYVSVEHMPLRYGRCCAIGYLRHTGTPCMHLKRDLSFERDLSIILSIFGKAHCALLSAVLTKDLSSAAGGKKRCRIRDDEITY